MNAKLEQLIGRLQKIARKNEDSFVYRVDIDPVRTGGFLFDFVCEENEDRHLFVGGSGPDLETAVEAATKDIELACQAWGYRK